MTVGNWRVFHNDASSLGLHESTYQPHCRIFHARKDLMNASKEKAQEAQDALTEVIGFTSYVEGSDIDRSIKFLQEFLDAAKRKLPTEAAFARARKPQAPVGK